MNRLVLKVFDDEHVVYYYYPDGLGPCGEIEYIFGEDEPTILKLGNNDRGYFANKAMEFLDECIEWGMYPLRWLMAWN
ncbi:MAG: hypothetical protein LBT59_07165 [Clostridiales bacterium]|nr:hypothetical protein [Clostridiales bacterium]